MEVSREDYISILKSKRNNKLIKVITGVRRSGKSYLLFTLFKRELLKEGVKEDRIIEMAFDDFSFHAYTEPGELYTYIKRHIQTPDTYYILLDEIQLVKDFESVLNGLLRIPNVDIYVTGSNSKFLSSDIITEFRGRGDEIRVFPFSFSEFYSVFAGDKWEAWAQYCRYGGMPQLLTINSAREKEAYLKNLFLNVYLSDIVNRYAVRGQEELEILSLVLSSSVGSFTNPKKISDTFFSQRALTVAQTTISRYLGYLGDSFLISRAMRYDVKGRKYIASPVKYYFVDPGLRNARLNFRQMDEGHLMENILYNELLRRGFSVDVGAVQSYEKNKNGNAVRSFLEVDFVANMGSARYYIQSALEMTDKNKQDQERKSLLQIKDAFRRVIIERTPMSPWHDNDGILHLGLMDFLLEPGSLDF